jgi:hypothetical protein
MQTIADRKIVIRALAREDLGAVVPIILRSWRAAAPTCSP